MARSKRKSSSKSSGKKTKKSSRKIAAKPVSKLSAFKVAPKKRLKIDPAYLPLLKRLQDRRNAITGQVNHLETDLREEIADNQNVPGDMADHGTGELTQHLSLTLMENDRIELDRIEKALSHITDGSYGLCEICKKSIPMARLKAIPWATRCINCQSRMEGA